MEESAKLPTSKDISPANSKRNTLLPRESKSVPSPSIPTLDPSSFPSGIPPDRKNLEDSERDTTLVQTQPSSCSMSPPESPTRMSPSGTRISPVFAITSQSFWLETKWTRRTDYQYEKPFLWILRTLSGDPNLYLVEAVALKPAEFNMDPSHIQELVDDWKEADNQVLPD